MPDKTQEARGRRSQARERRRGRVEEPVEELDRSAEGPGSESPSATNGPLGGAAAKVVGTAVAAGLLGALGGAVKAALERREEDSPPSEREPEPKVAADGEGTAPEAPSDEAEPEPEPEQRHQPEPEPEQRHQPEPEPEPEQPSEEEAQPAVAEPGLSEGDAEAVVSTARRRLEALLGTDVERVSGLERANGSWSVQLEVVEVARIPESTDILATYEVILGDDGDLVGVSRVRRYRRSQVEEEA
jgi:Gas vesicle synthesis protein GvpO